MMRNRGIFLLIGFLFVFSTFFGQKVDSEELLEKINKDVIKFLVKENELNENFTYEEYLNQFYIIEMIEKKIVGYNKNGLYRFSVLNSPSYTYLLLKNDHNYKLLDLKNIDTVLLEVLKFLIEIDTPKDKIVQYIEKVISEYKGNGYNDNIRM